MTQVAIAQERGSSDREGLIESMNRRRSEVEARIVLDDGTAAVAVLPHDDADWLEIERGDIVFVTLA